MLPNQLFGFSSKVNINPSGGIGLLNLLASCGKISFLLDYQKPSFNCKLWAKGLTPANFLNKRHC